MAARTGVRGLSTEELQSIQDGLAAGRRPRVEFTAAAGQIAGQIGQVVALTDPAQSDDWVVVRFGRDELPFSPGDLRIAPKGAARRTAVASPAAGPSAARSRPEPEFVIDKPLRGHSAPPASGSAPGSAPSAGAALGPSARAGTNETPPVPAPRTSAGGALSGKSMGDGVPVPAPRKSIGGADPAPRESTGGAAPAPRESARDGVPARRKAASRSGKAGAPAGLTVTLAYAGGEWTVAAAQGAKALAKPYVIRPAEALRMVSLVDVPGVQEAVEQILAAERAEAEEQAVRLRAELAEIEARLEELRDAG
jgi:hypothetical protein